MHAEFFYVIIGVLIADATLNNAAHIKVIKFKKRRCEYKTTCSSI